MEAPYLLRYSVGYCIIAQPVLRTIINEGSASLCPMASLSLGFELSLPPSKTLFTHLPPHLLLHPLSLPQNLVPSSLIINL